MDRFFTNMTIAKYLLSKGITIVGTLRTDRIGIPTEIKQINERESPSSIYVYNEEYCWYLMLSRKDQSKEKCWY